MKAIILSLMLLLPKVIHAQVSEGYKSSIAFNLGYQKNYLQDNLFSPLNQNGGGLALGLGYERRTQHIFGVCISFSSGDLKSGENDHFTSSYINANLGLEYLMNIAHQSESTKFYLGGVYNTRVLFYDWSDLDAFSFTSAHGISLKGMAIKKINDKNSLRTSLALPVLQFLGRPPYNGIDEFIIDNQDEPAKIIFSGNLTSLNKYSGIEWKLGYTHHLSPRLNWDIHNTLLFQKVKEINDSKSLSNTISTGLTFKL